MPEKSKRISYEKPELTEIRLLDESAMGESGFGEEEPPLPAPPGGAPSQVTPETDEWSSRKW